MTYCIDTSSLVHAWIRRYPPDIFESLWRELERRIDRGEIIAPVEVLHELGKKDDGLHAWAKAHSRMFQELTEDVQREVRDVLRKHPKLVKEFSGRNHADPFVIAQAVVAQCVVVTEEDRGTLEKPKIPIVCEDMGIKCIAVLDMIRAFGLRF